MLNTFKNSYCPFVFLFLFENWLFNESAYLLIDSFILLAFSFCVIIIKKFYIPRLEIILQYIISLFNVPYIFNLL